MKGTYYRVTNRDALPCVHAFSSVTYPEEEDLYAGAQVWEEVESIIQALMGVDPDTYTDAEVLTEYESDRILIIEGDAVRPRGSIYPVVKPGDVESLSSLPIDEAEEVITSVLQSDGLGEVSKGEIYAYESPEWPGDPDQVPPEVREISESIDMNDPDNPNAGRVYLDAEEWLKLRKEEIEKAFKQKASEVPVRWDIPPFAEGAGDNLPEVCEEARDYQASRVARRYLKKKEGGSFESDFKSYYDYEGDKSLREVSCLWTNHNHRPRDIRWKAHGWFDIDTVDRLKEFDRSKSNMRNLRPEEWKDLKESMKEKGWKEDQPGIIDFDQYGHALLVEGNHRLAIAKEIGIERVPIRFTFNESYEIDGPKICPEAEVTSKKASSKLEGLKSYLRGKQGYEKSLDLIRHFPHKAASFIFNSTDLARRFEEETGLVASSVPRIEKTMSQYPGELPEDLARDLADRIKSEVNLLQSPSSPSWVFFEYRGEIQDSWLVHLTDEADQIKENGFEGFPNYEKLGLTTQLSKRHPSGWVFACEPETFDKGECGSNERGESFYGTEAVLFKAPGLKVYHRTDKERQVIFWSEDAKNIISVKRGNGGWKPHIEGSPTFDSISSVSSYLQRHGSSDRPSGRPPDREPRGRSHWREELPSSSTKSSDTKWVQGALLDTIFLTPMEKNLDQIKSSSSGERKQGVRVGDIDQSRWGDEGPLSGEWGGSSSDPREGISVVEDWHDLVTYFSQSPYQTGTGPRPRSTPQDLKGETLVWLEGRPSPDEDHDAGDPGDPFLLTEPIEVLKRRELTPEEVYQLNYGDMPFQGPEDVEQRLEEMRKAYDRKTAEDVVGVEPKKEGYDLDGFLRDADGSYVVWDEGGEDPSHRDEAVIWHDAWGEYGTVPSMDVRRKKEGRIVQKYAARNVEFENEPAWGRKINALVDGKVVGHIDLAPQSYEQLTPECQHLYDDLPLDDPKIFAVERSYLVDDLHGEGLGTEMYVEAVEQASEEGGVVVMGGCSEDLPVGTSDQARRVWEGRRFQSRVNTKGEKIAWV